MIGQASDSSKRPGAAPIAPEAWSASAPWIRVGMRTVLWLVGGLLLFSMLVSISGAVVATGIVTVETKYQSVQHLDGGIVKQILVKNGQHVRAGQTLVVLEETNAKADISAIRTRIADLSIQEARLEAERDGLNEMTLPRGLDRKQPDIANAIKAQEALFKARRKTRLGEQSVLVQRIRQLEGEIRSLKAQRTARQKEREINAAELETILPLFERGYVSQQRLSPLRREEARLDGELGRLDAEMGKTQSALAESELRRAQAEKQLLSDVIEELGRVQANLAEQRQAEKKLAGVLSRTAIKAPRSGRVHGLSVHTIGAVVGPATQIAQIIPDGDRLIVQAELPPREIDRVRPGLAASILFPAFNARTTPRLTGSVVKVSPAETRDEQGRTFYTATIDITPDELAKIGTGHALIPGMPAEVFIETSSRSILSYILKPLTDTMMRSFRER